MAWIIIAPTMSEDDNHLFQNSIKIGHLARPYQPQLGLGMFIEYEDRPYTSRSAGAKNIWNTFRPYTLGNR